MSLLGDIRDAQQRFGKYIKDFKCLFQAHGIAAKDWYGFYAKFKQAWQDHEFKVQWNSIWNEITEQEGGKLSISVILGIVGATLGAIGVAGFGTAVGLPLVLLFVPAGAAFGNEFDQEGGTKKLVRWFRGLLGPAKAAEAPNEIALSHAADQNEVFTGAPIENGDVADSTEEGLAVLLELLRENARRCTVLEEEGERSESVISRLTFEVSSVSDRLTSSSGQFQNALSGMGTRLKTLEQENLKLKGDLARLSDCFTSMKAEAEATQSEMGTLRHRVAYLSWGLSVVGLGLVLELIRRLAR